MLNTWNRALVEYLGADHLKIPDLLYGETVARLPEDEYPHDLGNVVGLVDQLLDSLTHVIAKALC